MTGTKRSVCFLCIGLGLLSALAFIPLQKAPDSPVFFDNFEEYLNNKDIKQAYTIWEDGADLPPQHVPLLMIVQPIEIG